MPEQHVEAHDISVVGVAIVGDKPVGPGSFIDTRNVCDPEHLDVRADEVPIEPVRDLARVNDDPIGPEHLEGRGDGQIMYERKRSVLRAEPVYEMHETTHDSEKVVPVPIGSGARVLVVLPIRPQPTGNGLAMRAWRHCRSFPDDELIAVVLPISDGASEIWHKPPGTALEQATITPLAEPDRETFQAGFTRLLASAEWRARLQNIEPLPERARLAHPALAHHVVEAIQSVRRTGPATTPTPAPDVVIVFRSYLAPLGLAVAELLCASRTLVDLDDDDASLAAASGATEEAAAYERLMGHICPEFSCVTLASPNDASRLAALHRSVAFEHLPNAIDVPENALDYGLRSATVTMVANFTYPPNRRGAQWLTDEIWPLLEVRAPGRFSLRLVGPGIDRVDDVSPVYRESSVMAVPLLEGGGTRIKVLEAWALGRPVVSTTIGVEGLDARHGIDVLVADEPAGFADALLSVLDNDLMAAKLIDGGRSTVRRFRSDLIESRLRALALGG